VMKASFNMVLNSKSEIVLLLRIAQSLTIGFVSLMTISTSVGYRVIPSNPI